jgi:alkyldihydroxyacetonephosphate synthase
MASDPSGQAAPALAALRAALGDIVETSPEVLASHRRDSWVLSELDDLVGAGAPSPLAVLSPRDTEEVSRVLALCRKHRVPVVPFGGGSGVCGGVRVDAGTVVLATAGITGLREFSDADLTASFGAGTQGMEAERLVRERGHTIGHWPQSIELSTVGGWVATRASGQYSTAYGNIEDLVMDLTAVLPDGSVVRTRRTPRASAGPDLRQLFLGSEGTLGVVTEVTLSTRPLPEASLGQAFHFADFAAGIDGIRRFIRDGWRPPVVRLYDARESERHFPEACPEGRAMLILLHEGPAPLVSVQNEAVGRICAAAGGAAADPAAVSQWHEKRNHVPGFRPFLEQGVILDTIEVACTWSRVGDLYGMATDSLRQVPGVLLATAHSSHSYRSGTNLYITFVARPEDREQMAATYRECWRRTMDATLAAGGGIAHHHGIGRVRRGRLHEELGDGGLALLRAVKRAVDPDDLLNPGVLLPAAEPPAGAP